MKITKQNLRKLINETLASRDLRGGVEAISHTLNFNEFDNTVSKNPKRRWSQGLPGSSTGRSYSPPEHVLVFGDSETRNAAFRFMETDMGYERISKKPEGGSGGSAIVFLKKGRMVASITQAQTPASYGTQPAIGFQTAAVLRNPYYSD